MEKKYDEDTLLADWERFKIKAVNREHKDIKEMHRIFETWLKIKYGSLLE